MTTTNSPFYRYRDFMIEEYGAPLYRVPLDFNTGCPNRRADGSGGCSFCSERGGRAMQITDYDDVKSQLQAALKFARERYDAREFMAYIQAFSADFSPENCRRYLEVLSSYNFRAISFGVRPDSLTPAALQFLTELQKQIDVLIELGIQTTHDHTLKRINRGHDWACSVTAIEKLASRGLKTAAHVIIGLPGENREEFIATARRLAELPLSAIKIHNLHVETKSDLALEYQQNPFPTFDEYEYAEHLIEFLRHLPPGLPIIRINTDTPPGETLAPHWQMNKNQFLDYVTGEMKCRDVSQGDLFATENKALSTETDRPLLTADSSVTLWSDDYREHYHTTQGARYQARHHFLEPANLRERLERGGLHLLDIGFGMGYNSLSALNLATELNGELVITALEKDRRGVATAARIVRPEEDDNFDWRECLEQIYKEGEFVVARARLSLIRGDARYTIRQLSDKSVDLVFLDPFSLRRNSELSTLDFFRQLRRVAKNEALVVTRSTAAAVRAAFFRAGFAVGEIASERSGVRGTVAAVNSVELKYRLTPETMKRIYSPWGLVYRDPGGASSQREILANREERIVRYKKRLARETGLTAVDSKE